FFHLVREREVSVIKNTEKFRPAPRGNCFQLGSCSNNIEPVAPEFEQQIAIVLSVAAFCGGQKLRGTGTPCGVCISSCPQVSRAILAISRGRWLRGHSLRARLR